MRTIPRDTSIDGTLALLRDPYGFIWVRLLWNDAGQVT